MSLLLIDGSSIIYRAFYAFPALTHKDMPVNALYGFCRILHSIIEQNRSDITHIIIAMDTRHEACARKEIYKEYKANRKAPPPDLASQFQLINNAITAFNIPIYKKDGFEADDVIATLAKQASQDNHDVIIVSSDKDLIQTLVHKNVRLYDQKSGFISAALVQRRFGVPPSRFLDLQALMGDSTDNIPGVPGIGIKSAQALLSEHENIDVLIACAMRDPEANRLYKKVLDHVPQLKTSYMLAMLRDNLDIQLDIAQSAMWDLASPKAIDFLQQYNFASLLSELPVFNQAHTPKEKELAITQADKFELWISHAHHDGWRVSLFLDDASVSVHIFNGENTANISLKVDWIKVRLIELLNNPTVLKIVWDIKAICHFLGCNAWQNVHDIMLMAYNYKGKQASMSSIASSLQVNCDAAGLSKMHDLLSLALIKSGCLDVFHIIDQPIALLLHEMEINGIYIDKATLGKNLVQLRTTIESQKKDLIALSEQDDLNPSSNQQIAAVLIKQGASLKQTPKGSFIVDEDALAKLAKSFTFASKVLQWRKINTILVRYNSLGNCTGPDARIHTTFHMNKTLTGRLSSSNPNLQQIPARGELAHIVRQAFQARDGYILLSADYSNIDLRSIAHMAQVRSMIDIFKDNGDIHSHTAKQIFSGSDKDIAEQRKIAKIINFGLIYGQGKRALSEQLKISIAQAQEYIDEYFSQYPQILEYRQLCIAKLYEQGYVQTITGRRCYIDEGTSYKRELTACNAPIQGTSSEIVKISMLELDKQIKQQKLDAHLLLQIHDELIIEACISQIHKLKRLIQYVMSKSVKLSLPLHVSLKAGKDLANMLPM